MSVAALIVAVVGVLLAASSLVWQAATYFLTGPRVRVTVAEGLRGPSGAMIGALAVYSDGGDAVRRLGYTEHVVAIQATNRGRMPATIMNWSLQFGNGASYQHPQDPWNPTLPHRLEPHAEVTWLAPVSLVLATVAAFRDQADRVRTVRGQVLVAGREKPAVSRSALIVRDGGIASRHGRLARAVALIRRKRLY